MRATVDEKLHATLEQRLGESFRQVAERLEQVHKGLGEMQTLASDVGSLQPRADQRQDARHLRRGAARGAARAGVHARAVRDATSRRVPGSGARVEFAIRLPGRRDDGAPLWLPIDCKFPREDYERLLDAQERADRGRRRGRRARDRDAHAHGGADDPREVRRRRRTRPTSRSCSCRPKGCMPKRCAGPAWSRACSATTASCSPARRRCWRR